MESAEQCTVMPDETAVLAADPASESSGDAVSKRQTGLHYSREELVRISKLPAAHVRPEFLKAECNGATGLWNPSKHEKYEQSGWSSNRTTSTGSTFSTRTGDPDTGKTRLGPQNPGNWIRGCDPKMQEAKPVPDATSQSNGSKNPTTSELSVPPGLRVAQDKRPAPVRTSNPLHSDWRSDKQHSGRPEPHRMDAAGGRFGHQEFDSRSRSGPRTLSFNNKNAGSSSHYSNNSQHRNNYEETPEWMTEPTSKFEMMTLGGFEDDRRGSPEKQPVPEPASRDTAPDERSHTPDFERMMKDMLNFTDEDSVTEIPVTLPEDRDTGSKSAKWFGGREPQYEQRPDSRRHNVQNDLMQILQRANISLNQVQGHQPHLPKTVQAKSLHEIEGGLRSDPSPAGAEDKQAFNKLLDLLSRRSSGQQQPVQFPAPPPGRPSSYEIEEMNRQRKLLEAHSEHTDLQQQQQQQQQQQKGRHFPPAFSMVPIQVIRNATATDRRGLLPHESHDMNTQPRAITGSAQSHALQRPAARLPASPFGVEFDMQRQAMLQQEMRQRATNFSPVGRPADLRPALSAQQMQQLQQLQMMNQQLHQLNPSQLQQTRGMSAAQIQQFLLRSANS